MDIDYPTEPTLASSPIPINTNQSNLEMDLDTVDPSLKPIAQKLLNIKTQLKSALDSKSINSAEQLHKYQYRLNEIEVENKTELVWKNKSYTGTGNKDNIPPGQAVLNELLDSCHDLINLIVDGLNEPPIRKELTKQERRKLQDIQFMKSATPGIEIKQEERLKRRPRLTTEELIEKAVHPELQSIAVKLLHYKRELQRICDREKFQPLTDASELRKYQYRLDDLETEYKSDYLVWRPKAVKNEVLPGQAILTGLLDDCHDIIDELIDIIPDSKAIELGLQKRKSNVSESINARGTSATKHESVNKIDRIGAESPSMIVHPSLQGIANQLLNIQARLIEVKRNNLIQDATELRKHQYKLDDLEREYKVNYLVWKTKETPENEIPPGQAALNELLDNCHDLIDQIIDNLPEGQKIEKRNRPRTTTSTSTSSSGLEKYWSIPDRTGPAAHDIPDSHLKHEAGNIKRQQFQEKDTTII